MSQNIPGKTHGKGALRHILLGQASNFDAKKDGKLRVGTVEPHRGEEVEEDETEYLIDVWVDHNVIQGNLMLR